MLGLGARDARRWGRGWQLPLGTPKNRAQPSQAPPTEGSPPPHSPPTPQSPPTASPRWDHARYLAAPASSQDLNQPVPTLTSRSTSSRVSGTPPMRGSVTWGSLSAPWPW